MIERPLANRNPYPIAHRKCPVRIALAPLHHFRICRLPANFPLRNCFCCVLVISLSILVHAVQCKTSTLGLCRQQVRGLLVHEVHAGVDVDLALGPILGLSVRLHLARSNFCIDGLAI